MRQAGHAPKWLVILVDVCEIAVFALRQHRLRAFLSTLGVGLGVACVTSMLSITEGARQEAVRHVEQLGVSNLLVRHQLSEGSSARDVAGARLRVSDAERLRQVLAHVRHAVPVLERFVTVKATRPATSAPVITTTASYFRMMNLSLNAGAPWSRGSRRVCVLGAGLAMQVFGRLDVIGERVRLENTWYHVVGVLEEQSVVNDRNIPLPVRDHNSLALVPLESPLGPAAFRADGKVSSLWVVARPGTDVLRLKASVATVLSAAGLSSIEVIAPLELLRARNRTLRTFNVVVGAVTALSLLVSGIGILNTMLAAVIERTQEIGVRRAVGARRVWITLQFLLEGVMMALLGGVAGAVLGGAISKVVAFAVGWPSHLSLWAFMVSLALAVTTGTLASAYPALRAARLQPIDAVRHE